MQKNRARSSPRYAPDPPPTPRGCDIPGCVASGEYRAPKARDRLNDYYWFCLDHVREYNKAWDYYAGMTPEEIEANLRRDTTWQRPTWPMGSWHAREQALHEEAMRHYHFRGRSESQYKGTGWGESPPRKRSAEDDALSLLDLDPPVSFDQIKARYRELVKLHHPDANGGDKESEERLKQINQAYTTLKASYGA